MSVNQPRPERSNSSQFKKSDRSASFAQPSNFSGGSGKGGGTAPPQSSSSINSALSSNGSFKKSNNGQGGQSRAIGGIVNSDSNYSSAARTLQNGSHLQTPVHGAADAPLTVKPTSNLFTQKSTQAVPKAPSSQPATVNSDSTAPATPSKASGHASTSFTLQFGSISPGVMNGMQIPARTNSAPPNLDEQQCDQARHDSSRMVSTCPIPCGPKKQMLRKEGGANDQSNIEVHQISKAKRDVVVSSASPVTQTQKASVHPISGVSIPMAFHQSQVPIQFGGPKPPIQSQGMAATSLPIPMPMSLPMGNAPSLQQPVFVPSLQHHPMQPQGIMHQHQGSLNFTPQMSPHVPPQLGNLGMSIGAQLAQHQAGRIGGSRKPVKITHPDTHEELKLDKRADAYMDGGSTGPRSHPNLPQAQTISAVPPGHPINYYPNSYNPNSLFYPAPSSVPLSSPQINSGPQASRFSYPVSQGTKTVSFMNPTAHNTYSSKNSAALHGVAEPSSLEPSRDVRNAMSSAPPASVQVTVKPPTGLHVEKIADSSLGTSLPSVEKGESPVFFQQHGEASLIHLQRDSKTSLEISAQQPNNSLEPTLSPVSVEGIVPNSLSSVPLDPHEKSALVVTNNAENRRTETITSDSVKDEQKKQIKKGFSQPQHQVIGQSTLISSLPSQSLGYANSLNSATTETTATKIPASSSARVSIVESTKEPLSTHSTSTADTPEFRDERGSTYESSEAFGDLAVVDSLDNDHRDRQNETLQDEPKLETIGTREKVGIVLSEGPKQDKIRSVTSSESISVKSSEEPVNLIEPNTVMKVTTNFHVVGSLEIVQKDLEEPVSHCTKDDVVVNNIMISTSLVNNVMISTSLEPNDTNVKISSSRPTFSNGDNKTSISDVSFNGTDSLASRPAVVTNSVVSDDGEAPGSTIPSVSEPTLNREGEGTEDENAGLVSLPAVGSTDKSMLELSRSKSTMIRGKKKKKEISTKS